VAATGDANFAVAVVGVPGQEPYARRRQVLVEQNRLIVGELLQLVQWREVVRVFAAVAAATPVGAGGDALWV
jgi:hypothetical protein